MSVIGLPTSLGINWVIWLVFMVIPGMTTMGTIASYMTVEGGKVYLDKAKSRVIRFKQADPTL